MVHSVAVRFLARRLGRRFASRAARRVVSFDPDRQKELRADLAGFSVGVSLPSRADSLDDLPL